MSPFDIIKQTRKAKGITQKRMAAKLKVNLKTYQRFENEKNKTDILVRTCRELGITVLVINDENILTNDKA